MCFDLAYTDTLIVQVKKWYDFGDLDPIIKATVGPKLLKKGLSDLN